MATPDEIRAMRLAKLEAAAKKQKLNNIDLTSTTNQSDHESGKASNAINSEAIPRLESSSKGSIPTIEKEQINLDRWKANELKRTLSVTLSPEDNSKALTYLESLNSELGSTDLISVNGPDEILTTLIFDQGIGNTFSSPLQYLFTSWSLASKSKGLLPKSSQHYNEKLNFYDEIIRLCSGYASILFYEPDTFIDNPNLNSIINELINNIDRYTDYWISILNSVVDNQTQIEFLNSILPKLTEGINASLNSNSLSINIGSSNSSKYNNILLIIEILTYNKNICSFIHQIDCFIPNTDDAVQLELHSFLGRILRISPLLPQISLHNYVGILNKSEIKSINQSLETTYSILLNKLFNIVDSLIRINVDSRNQVLRFMAKLINKNHLRMSEHADGKKLSSDSLILNITLILFKLSEPILREGNLSKVDKISVDYLNYSNKLIDIEEETRINSTIQDCNEYFKDKLYDDKKNLNFISQCFYLMLTYLQYGLGGLIVSYNKKNKLSKQLASQLKQFKEVINENKMSSNPFAERLIKMRMEPLEKKIKSLQNDIYSIDMFFQCRNFQLEIFDIIIGVCEFLVRLIDLKHEYHPKFGNFFPYLQIPLHNFDDDIEKLDDVEYLRKLSPIPFKYYPEMYVEGLVNYCHFISKYNNNPMIDNNNRLTKFIEFSIIVLRCPELVSNPHLKARLTEVLFFGSLPIQTNNGGGDGFMISIFNDDVVVQRNLLISLLDFYVMVEKTGASSQFYDKFNSRYHISFIIEKLWKFDIFKQDLKIIATKYQKFFIRFVARMLNDTTYLLDESLNHLHTIHNCQKELNNRSKGIPSANEESDEDLQKKLQESERMAKSFVQLSNKTILLFNLFTCETPGSFTIVEIVDRLAGMLNYNLVVLVGPSYNELKVQNPEKYQFDPKELLLQLSSIFINLSKNEDFIKAVARDSRSFEPDNFYKAINILKKSYKLPDENFQKDLIEFVEKAKTIKIADEEEELELGEVPDEFLDPLMYTLMKDPVKLPTSKISIDRSVLKAHLMNDPTDPFNRMPLKMEEVSDDVELRDRITSWIQEKRREKREGLANKSFDTDNDVVMQ
jgi:ubiquitin conjugation factor E4 B